MSLLQLVHDEDAKRHNTTPAGGGANANTAHRSGRHVYRHAAAAAGAPRGGGGGASESVTGYARRPLDNVELVYGGKHLRDSTGDDDAATIERYGIGAIHLAYLTVTRSCYQTIFLRLDDVVPLPPLRWRHGRTF